MKKSHGIRKRGKHNVFYIKAECSNCNESETLSCYEDNIDKRRFNLRFVECPNCFRIFCMDCDEGYCPDCKRVKLRELTPLEVYRCNLCFLDERKMLCLPCKYPHIKKKPVK
jgi:hypothetical protein